MEASLGCRVETLSLKERKRDRDTEREEAKDKEGDKKGEGGRDVRRKNQERKIKERRKERGGKGRAKENVCSRKVWFTLQEVDRPLACQRDNQNEKNLVFNP